jgi:hypothetical protein
VNCIAWKKVEAASCEIMQTCVTLYSICMLACLFVLLLLHKDYSSMLSLIIGVSGTTCRQCAW